MEQLTDAQKKNLKVLTRFVRVYCDAKHGDELKVKVEFNEVTEKNLHLCRECAGVLEYALMKRRNCPLVPKPSCKNCRIHCYAKEKRARVREIMAFSGRRLILLGRLDYLRHYFF